MLQSYLAILSIYENLSYHLVVQPSEMDSAGWIFAVYIVKSIVDAPKTCAGKQNRGACNVLSALNSNHYRGHVLGMF